VGHHYAATDTIEALGMRGKDITFVTENKEWGEDLEPIHKEVLKKRYNLGNGAALEGVPYKHKVKIYTQATVLEIRDGEAVLIDKNMEKIVVPCDDIVFCKTKEKPRCSTNDGGGAERSQYGRQ
jgi:hypothetical protein